MKTPELLVIGSANVDFVMSMGRLPGRGETVTDGCYRQVLGGKGANTAIAAARSGSRVAFLGAAANDPFGHQMRAAFAEAGIDTGAFALLPDRPCGSALIMVDAKGDNYIAVAPGANDAVTPERVRLAEARIAAADRVLLQMEIPVAANREALRLAARHGTPVLLNYAPVRGTPLALDAAIDPLIVNEVEAAALSGLAVDGPEEALAAAEALRHQGPKTVLVTLGAAGVVFASAEARGQVPAFPAKAVDTVAAGDTFCGALATALGEGRSLPEAARFASAAAAISVTRHGAQPSIPTRAEIDALLLGRSTR